jgi:hypothetical protein
VDAYRFAADRQRAMLVSWEDRSRHLTTLKVPDTPGPERPVRLVQRSRTLRRVPCDFGDNMRCRPYTAKPLAPLIFLSASGNQASAPKLKERLR